MYTICLMSSNSKLAYMGFFFKIIDVFVVFPIKVTYYTRGLKINSHHKDLK